MDLSTSETPAGYLPFAAGFRPKARQRPPQPPAAGRADPGIVQDDEGFPPRLRHRIAVPSVRRPAASCRGSRKALASAEVSTPATASHREMAPARRRRLGITDGLVRISVGIEDAEDIIADVVQALG